MVMDAGVTFAIIAQVILTALDASQLRGDIEIAQYQSVLINLALLVFLFRNAAHFRQKHVNSKASGAKAEVQVAEPANAEPKEEKVKGSNEVKA